MDTEQQGLVGQVVKAECVNGGTPHDAMVDTEPKPMTISGVERLYFVGRRAYKSGKLASPKFYVLPGTAADHR